MFNLIICPVMCPVDGMTEFEIEADRIFEHTEKDIEDEIIGKNTFANQQYNHKYNLTKLLEFPCLLLNETDETTEKQAAVFCKIEKATFFISERNRECFNVKFRNCLHFPWLTNSFLERISSSLHIRSKWDFRHTHWAVKPVDLPMVLLENTGDTDIGSKQDKIIPQTLDEEYDIAAMMPFSENFDAIYKAIERAGAKLNQKVARADNVWGNQFIINDIISLIAHSKIVVFDCTGQNPNVFYEMGIAHALDTKFILITQDLKDIPFDTNHIRHLRYKNSQEGLETLVSRLSDLIPMIKNQDNSSVLYLYNH